MSNTHSLFDEIGHATYLRHQKEETLKKNPPSSKEIETQIKKHQEWIAEIIATPEKHTFEEIQYQRYLEEQTKSK